MSELLGIHHVTALCADAQKNMDFYTGVLGLRLVKLTVNFDDPSAYHLYYGDTVGSPGTILTFFNYGRSAPGARGAGAFTTISLGVPPGSLGFWADRLESRFVERHTNAFGEPYLSVDDPDGLHLQLVEYSTTNPSVWTGGGMRVDEAIHGIAGVTLGSRTIASAQFIGQSLRLHLDFEAPLQSGNSIGRFGLGPACLDVLPTTHRSMAGRGTIHHVAFRVKSDKDQLKWHADISSGKAPVSEVRDRVYFRSIYFREPGGALLEIATDGPGFAVDERVEDLGSSLKLPSAYLPMRSEIENALPRLRLPVSVH